MKNRICKYHQGKKTDPHRCLSFDISMGRTGTRSICSVIQRLGIRAAHGFNFCPSCMQDGIEKYLRHQCDLDLYKTCEFSANISMLHWRQLAKEIPESRFILPVRPLHGWLESWEKLSSKDEGRLKDALTMPIEWNSIRRIHSYQMVTFHSELWAGAYLKHNREIQEYFKGTSRLLVLNVWEMSDAELWEKLGEFFDRPTPKNEPFPCLKKSKRIYLEDVKGTLWRTGK